MNTKKLLDEKLEIRQHNVITTASQQLSALEMDIIFCLFRLLHKDDCSGTYYRLYIKDLERFTGRKWNHKQLMAAAARLRSQKLLFGPGKNQLEVGWLASVEYLHGQGCLELELSEKIRPFLLDLEGNFTSFRLQAALRLTSKHSKRIYQLVSQWKDRGQTPNYLISELKTLLGLNQATTGEKYEKISMLKKSVLDVAVQQINQHTELVISYELQKEGRSFTAIHFIIERQRQQVPLAADLPAAGRLQMARQKLAELEICDSRLINPSCGLATGLVEGVYEDEQGQLEYEARCGYGV